MSDMNIYLIDDNEDLVDIYNISKKKIYVGLI